MLNIDLAARVAAGALFIVLTGCASQNDQAPAVSATGQHSATWIVDHRNAYAVNPGQCQTCHGTDLEGGIAKVDCFNQGNLPGCHAGGHAPRVPDHPIPFTDPALHGVTAKANLVHCQRCHGQPGGAGTNPRFNVPIGTLTVGCEGAGCHNRVNTALPNRSSAHPRPWRGHNSSGNQQLACALCHGGSLFGGPATGGVGPACNSCHTALGLGVLPTAGSCNSCHLSPPASGSHGAHLAISGITCNACHTGGGTGTPNHGDGTVILAIPASYNAKSGAAAVSATTCSNVSCHGGIVTPAWGVGQINLATECTSCHTDGTGSPTDPPQFNSFRSGQHAVHVFDIGLSCTDCHDMTVTVGGASHLGALNTTAFELPASATIRGYINYLPAGPSCQPPSIAPSGNTVGACHANRRSWL